MRFKTPAPVFNVNGEHGARARRLFIYKSILPLGIIGNCLGAPGEKGRPADRAFKTNYKLYK
jgi:hypothetical protein